MSVSAIFGTRLSIPTASFRNGCAPLVKAAPPMRVGGGALVIESSSRPQKKATAHHRKSRPKKTQPWDIKRGPTVYPPLPEMPPEWTLVTDSTVEEASGGGIAGESAEAVVDVVPSV